MKRKYFKRKTQPVDKLGCNKLPVGNLFGISSEGLRPGQWPGREAVLHMSRIEFEFRPTEFKRKKRAFRWKFVHLVWLTWDVRAKEFASKWKWIKEIRFSEYLDNSWDCGVKYIRLFKAAHSFCCTHIYERMWQFINIQSFCGKCRKSRLVYSWGISLDAETSGMCHECVTRNHQPSFNPIQSFI